MYNLWQFDGTPPISGNLQMFYFSFHCLSPNDTSQRFRKIHPSISIHHLHDFGWMVTIHALSLSNQFFFVSSFAGKFSTKKISRFPRSRFSSKLKSTKTTHKKCTALFCIVSLHIVSFLVYGWPHAVWY